jgi:putative transcriptional regulator
VSSALCRKRNLLGALFALALLCAIPWSGAQDKKPLTAMLLVAGADVSDPDFADSVVLVMNNLGEAPVGIIVNRPTPVAIAQLFPDLKRLAALHDRVYFGGPVDFDSDSVWFLFRASKAPANAVQACDGVYVSADHGLLVQLLSRDKPMEGLRIFVGHAGWLPGQLEAEIAHGDWKLEHARSESIFDGKDEHPWPGSQQHKGST